MRITTERSSCGEITHDPVRLYIYVYIVRFDLTASAVATVCDATELPIDAGNLSSPGAYANWLLVCIVENPSG